MIFTSLFNRVKYKLLWGMFFIVILFNFVAIIPTFMINTIITRASKDKLKIYNQSGTFWHGSGLLVVNNNKKEPIAPILLLNWKISFGLTKFINLHLFTGNATIADVYVDKQGVNIDNLSLSLSATQVSQLVDIVRDVQLSGNIHLQSKHMLVTKDKAQGMLTIDFVNVSSGLSPVNPLGNYVISLNSATGAIEVTSKPGSTLSLSGSGSLNSLQINASVAKDKQEQLKSFMVAFSDGQVKDSYIIKVF